MEESLKEHIQVMQQLKCHSKELDSVCDEIWRTVENGRKLLMCGNGGSAADAQHFAGELVGRFKKERRPIAAIALTCDSSVVTCVGNDFGFDQVFARQVEALGQSGDIFLAITTSGNSRNVELALHQAKKSGLFTIGFLGNDGGSVRNLCDLSIVVNSMNTARIQEAHIFLIHSICENLDLAFG